MTAAYTAADQRRECADDLYSRGGHYVLCEAVTDPIIGGGYRDIRPIDYDEALTIRLAPLQALRHATPQGE
jgi:hypothetical protein